MAIVPYRDKFTIKFESPDNRALTGNGASLHAYTYVSAESTFYVTLCGTDTFLKYGNPDTTNPLEEHAFVIESLSYETAIEYFPLYGTSGTFALTNMQYSCDATGNPTLFVAIPALGNNALPGDPIRFNDRLTLINLLTHTTLGYGLVNNIDVIAACSLFFPCYLNPFYNIVTLNLVTSQELVPMTTATSPVIVIITRCCKCLQRSGKCGCKKRL